MFERLFCTIAWLLGADIFKKYWPVRGSKWNETHINPNSSSDLQTVIKESYEFTRQHAQIFLTVTIITFLDWSFDIGYIKLKYYFLVLTPMELYALMIHHYNRIKARQRIHRIKLNPVEKESLVETDPIYITEATGDSNFFYFNTKLTTYKPPVTYYCTVYGGGGGSPLFRTREEAEEFREFLYSKYSRDFVTLYNDLTSDSMRNYYNIFMGKITS